MDLSWLGRTGPRHPIFDEEEARSASIKQTPHHHPDGGRRGDFGREAPGRFGRAVLARIGPSRGVADSSEAPANCQGRFLRPGRPGRTRSTLPIERPPTRNPASIARHYSIGRRESGREDCDGQFDPSWMETRHAQRKRPMSCDIGQILQSPSTIRGDASNRRGSEPAVGILAVARVEVAILQAHVDLVGSCRYIPRSGRARRRDAWASRRLQTGSASPSSGRRRASPCRTRILRLFRPGWIDSTIRQGRSPTLAWGWKKIWTDSPG